MRGLDLTELLPFAMEIIQNWAVEILVALLTTIGVFLFKAYLHPYLLGVIQKTPDVSGVWIGSDISEGVESDTSRLEIKQLGANLRATVHRRSESAGERVFKYKGIIAGGKVVMTWKEEKSNGYNVGTLTLALSGNLQSMKGKTTFFHNDLGQVIAQDKVYRRVR